MCLKLKRVEKSDEKEVLELCKKIWEGHDYIPKVFDEWIEDNGFYKGIAEGRIVAVDKYTRIERDVIWLEGLRVHPDYQGRGYGKEMVEKFLELIEKKEDFSYLRFMTGATNEKMIKMAGEFGFELYLELHSLAVSEEVVEKGSKGRFKNRTQLVKSVDRVLNFVKNSEEFVHNKGLFIKNWTAHDITEELLVKEVEVGNCIYIENKNLKAVGFLDFYKPYNLLNFPFIAGKEERVKELLEHGIERMRLENRDYLTVKTGSDKIKEILLNVGFELTKHKKSLVFQR